MTHPWNSCRFIPLWPQAFLRLQVEHLFRLFLGCWKVKVSKLLDISPTLQDIIIGSGNKKQKNTEGDWIGDQGSHTEIPSLFFNKSLSQFSIPFLPQQDRNRNYKAEHTQLIIQTISNPEQLQFVQSNA